MSRVWVSFCRWRRWSLHILYWWLKEKLLRRYVAVLSFLCPGGGCLGSGGYLLCIDTFHFCKAGSGSPLWAAACNQVQWKMWFWGWWCYLQVRKTGDCIQGTHTPPPFSHFAVVTSQDMQAWVKSSNERIVFKLTKYLDLLLKTCRIQRECTQMKVWDMRMISLGWRLMSLLRKHLWKASENCKAFFEMHLFTMH